MEKAHRFLYEPPIADQNPGWLFDVFRSVASHSSDPTAPAHADVRTFCDALQRVHIDTAITAVEHSSGALGKFKDIIIPLAENTKELIRVFGDDYLKKLYSQVPDDVRDHIIKKSAEMEEKYIVTPEHPYAGMEHDVKTRAMLMAAEKEADNLTAYITFASMRDIAVLEFLHRELQIPSEVYSERVKEITAQLDKLGINGLERLLRVSPELEKKLKKSETRIEVPVWTDGTYIKPETPGGNTNHIGHVYKEMPRGEFYTSQLKKLDDERPSTEQTTSDYDYHQRVVALQHDAVGRAYCENVKKIHSAMIGKHNADLDNSLSLSNPELFDAMNRKNPDVPWHTAAWAYHIDNYLGATDPRLEYKFRAGNTDPKDLFFRADRISQKKEVGEYRPIFTEPANAQGNDVHVKRIIDPQKKTADYGDTSPRARNRREAGSENFSPEAETKTSPEDDKKHDKFVTAGKIGATTILGVGVIHGLGNLLKSEKPEKDSEGNDVAASKSKKIIHAIEAAASIAGIILVWKNPTVNKWFTKALQQSGKSA